MDPRPLRLIDVTAVAGGLVLLQAGLRHAWQAWRQHVTADALIGVGLACTALGGIVHGLALLTGQGDNVLLAKVTLLLAPAGVVLLRRATVVPGLGGVIGPLSLWLLGTTAVACVLLPSVPSGEVGAPGWWPPFVALYCLALGLGMAVATAGIHERVADLSGYAAARGRVLTISFGLLAIAYPLGMLGASLPGVTLDRIATVGTALLLAPALVGVISPSPLRERLRRPSVRRLDATLDDLAGRTSAGTFDAVLRAVADVIGATHVSLLDPTGSPRWSHGSPGNGQTLELPLRSGRLAYQVHPLAPLHGRAERDLLVRVGRDLDLALLAHERLEALAAERATREELEAARVRLDAINAALSDFGASVAHDLRTPLTVLRASVETVLAQETISAGGQDLLQRCLSHVARASELVEGHLATAHEPDRANLASLEHVVRWVHQTVEPELRGANAHLTWSAPLPTVPGSEALLRQVLLNLVRNAIRHAGPGPADVAAPGVTIAIVPSRDGRSVLVIDDGRGIPRWQWNEVLDDGRRVGGDGSRGLGLATSRAALERMGGGLSILDSHQGKGTTFAVHLPPAQRLDPEAPDAEVEAVAASAAIA